MRNKASSTLKKACDLLLDAESSVVPLVLAPLLAGPPWIAGSLRALLSPSVRSIGMVGPSLDFPKITVTLCVFRLIGGGETGFVLASGRGGTRFVLTIGSGGTEFVLASGGGGTGFVLVACVGVLEVILCVYSK
jgi:hypothetical protein